MVHGLEKATFWRFREAFVECTSVQTRLGKPGLFAQSSGSLGVGERGGSKELGATLRRKK